MRAIVVDDEKNVREVLVKMLHVFCPEVEVVGQADNIAKATDLMRAGDFDIAFLDIQLQDGTSLDLLYQFPERSFQCVFVTAYDQYAIDAFRLSAIDYLLKPVSPDLLQEAVARAKLSMGKGASPQALEVIRDYLRPTPLEQPRIILKDAENMFVVNIAEIIRCEADGGYTHFSLQDGRRIVTSHNLKEYDTLLKPLGFVRAHHAHLVNTRHIVNFSRQDGGMLHMTNNDLVPVSHRKREALLKAIQGGAIN
ncbi:MAG: LytR/AlgR family response regulator transcription factor [Bacteroidia bacterium]